MSISSPLLAIGPNSQTTTVPNQTFEVNLVWSMQPKNPLQPGGKKKRNKKKNSNAEQGTAPTQNNKGEEKKGIKKSLFPCHIFVEDHPTHQCP
jgi:hypothetical protein